MQNWTRALLTATVVVALTQSPALRGQGQTPAKAAVPTIPPEAPSTWTFAAGSGMVLFQVKPGSAPAFEAAVLRIKAALAASKDPVRRRQAQSWQVLKSTEPVGADDPIVYVFFMPVTVADSDYDPLQILTEQFPAEAQSTYDTISRGSTAINRMGLKKVTEMGPGS